MDVWFMGLRLEGSKRSWLTGLRALEPLIVRG